MKKFKTRVALVITVLGAAMQASTVLSQTITPTMPCPDYRHDAVKSEGWKDFSTPLLTYLRDTEPYRVQVSGDMRVTSIAIAPNGDLIVTTVYGVMRSRNQGKSWVRIDGEGKEKRGSFETGYPEGAGSTNIDPLNSDRMAFLFLRGTSYFTNGSTWKTIGNQGFDYASIDWTSTDPQLIAGPVHGSWNLRISRDGGATWTNYDNKLTGTGELGPSVGNGMVTVIDANTIIYNNRSDASAKPSGLFRSTDKGVTWTKLRDGLSNVSHVGTAFPDGRVYLAGDNKLWISRDKGATWTSRPATKASQGPFLFRDWSDGKVGGMLIKSDEVVSYSKDEGQTWITLIGGNSGNAFPPKSDGKVDKLIYGQHDTNGMYNTENCDYRYGNATWAFDPVRNVIYTSAMGGPIIFRQLPGKGPGPEPAGARMPEKTAR